MSRPCLPLVNPFWDLLAQAATGGGQEVVHRARDGFVIAVFAAEGPRVFGEAGDCDVSVFGLCSFGGENANVVIEPRGGGAALAHGYERTS